jgi:hypothetical protein
LFERRKEERDDGMEGKKAGRKAVNDEDTKEMIPC